MKNLFGLLFVCALFALTSCGGEDCIEDLSGVYTGTNDCAGSVENDVTVTISGTDGNYSVSGVVSSGDLDQSGCTLSYENSLFGIGEKVTITLNGTTLTVIQEEPASGLTLCTFTGSK